MRHRENTLKKSFQNRFSITYTIQNDLNEKDKKRLKNKIVKSNYDRIFLVLISTIIMQIVNFISEFMPHEIVEYCYYYLEFSVFYLILLLILLLVYVIIFFT